MPDRTTRERVRAALADADFPAMKDDLIATAQRAGADEETMRALRSIPPVDYHNRGEVMAALPVRDGAAEGSAAV
jgi:Protein of unknown function (DUF2795)